jgi:hypothetical protein
VLICARQAGGNLDGRVGSDAAKGIAAAARREVTKGTCCQREKRSARSRRRRGSQGERTCLGERERQRPRLIVPWGCGGAGGQQGWTSREIVALKLKLKKNFKMSLKEGQFKIKDSIL